MWDLCSKYQEQVSMWENTLFSNIGRRKKEVKSIGFLSTREFPSKENSSRHAVVLEASDHTVSIMLIEFRFVSFSKGFFYCFLAYGPFTVQGISTI